MHSARNKVLGFTLFHVTYGEGMGFEAGRGAEGWAAGGKQSSSSPADPAAALLVSTGSSPSDCCEVGKSMSPSTKPSSEEMTVSSSIGSAMICFFRDYEPEDVDDTRSASESGLWYAHDMCAKSSDIFVRACQLVF